MFTAKWTKGVVELKSVSNQGWLCGDTVHLCSPTKDICLKWDPVFQWKSKVMGGGTLQHFAHGGHRKYARKKKNNYKHINLQVSSVKRFVKSNLNGLSVAQESIQNLMELPFSIVPLISVAMFAFKWTKKLSNLAIEFQVPKICFLCWRVASFY